MSLDAIVVTLNYRLGHFGFLTWKTGDGHFRGNAGLMDQVMALEWVRDNIERFGGDPDRVTLAGNGAGAASAQILANYAPINETFQRVALQSGVADNVWAHHHPLTADVVSG